LKNQSSACRECSCRNILLYENVRTISRKLLARNGLTNWAVLDFQRYILTVNWFTSLLVILSGVVCREGPIHFRWARRNA